MKLARVLIPCTVLYACYIYVERPYQMDPRPLRKDANNDTAHTKDANNDTARRKDANNDTARRKDANNDTAPPVRTNNDERPLSFCLREPQMCSYGLEIARLANARTSTPRRGNGTSPKIYIRQAPGLPDWILFFFQQGSQACSSRCEMIKFDDTTVRAHATIQHQGFAQREPHEVQIYANMEAHSHEPIFERDERMFWHASFFLKSRVPITYSFLTYGGLNAYEMVRNAGGDVSRAWYGLFNAISHAQKSPSLGVAFVSNQCERHDNYYTKLMQLIPLDMMGECMRNRNEFDMQFEEAGLWRAEDIRQNRDLRKAVIASQYHFFISIENTIMEDYLTEKFWTGFLADSVMVYLGAPNADLYAPAPRSFINALHFESAHALGNYLLYLAQNKDEYNSYLTWKNGSVLSPNFYRHVYDAHDDPLLCRACRDLAQSNS